MFSTTLLGTVLAFASPRPQTPPAAAPTAADLVQRFERLPTERAELVLRNIEKRLARENGEVLQRIQGRQRGVAAYAQPPAPSWFQPSEFAPVATPRHLVGRGEPAHQRATHDVAPLRFLPDLHAEVTYDWGLGKAVRTGSQPTSHQRFANLAHGYVPSTDHAVAQVLEILDTDPTQRALGDYFAHLYADRDGAVFAGTTLFDAWHSGRVVEMPDTDAIAFGRRVLQTSAFTAPLPADRRRDRLYEKVRVAFAAYREYRSLRCAAAAAFAIATPRIDKAYAPLVDRCHWLWVQCGGDVARFAERLHQTSERADLLQEIDAAIKSSVDVIDDRRAALRGIDEYLRALADRELQNAGV